MNTLCYIVIKITVLSLIHLWTFAKCAKRTKKKTSSSSSYIEEDTKAEEKFARPMWDKNFPKILPPPERVLEKENKEVDVELDMLMMPDMMGDGGTPKAQPDNPPRSDMLDPNGLLFDDRTQGSLEKVKSKEFVMAMKKSAEMATQKSAEKSRRGMNLKRPSTTKSGSRKPSKPPRTETPRSLSSEIKSGVKEPNRKIIPSK